MQNIALNSHLFYIQSNPSIKATQGTMFLAFKHCVHINPIKLGESIKIQHI